MIYSTTRRALVGRNVIKCGRAFVAILIRPWEIIPEFLARLLIQFTCEKFSLFITFHSLEHLTDK